MKDHDVFVVTLQFLCKFPRLVGVYCFAHVVHLDVYVTFFLASQFYSVCSLDLLAFLLLNIDYCACGSCATLPSQQF